MSLQPGRPRFAAAIIERADNSLLIVISGEGESDRRWMFPRGPIEPNESAEAAIRRIAREQVNLHVELVVGQPPFLCEIGGQVSEIRYFFCAIGGGAVSPGPYLDVRWVLPAQLREYDFDAASTPVVEWLLEQRPT